jgi:AcrR family transcriptional regulator
MTSEPGLRERKKQKTRWAIQEHALRLFAEQGYDATTVEQIAAAAEISPSTFFRYYRTKEDVVVEDEYDPLLVGALKAAPADLKPIPALRHGVRTAFAQISADEQRQVYERTKLILSTPALRARNLETIAATIAVILEPLAERTGREPTDFALRAFAGACLGAWLVTISDWVDSGGEGDLGELMDRTLAAFEDGFGF